MIHKLKRKDTINFVDFCIYNQIRKDYKEAYSLLKEIFKSKYFCYVYDEADEIKGFVLVENFKEPILRIYVAEKNITHSLFKYVLWYHKEDLTLKLNRNSIVKYLCRKYKFFPVDEDDKEITFFRKKYEKRNKYSKYGRKEVKKE